MAAVSDLRIVWTSYARQNGKTRLPSQANPAVTDPATKESHLHEWRPAPDPNGNRAERRAAARKARRR